MRPAVILAGDPTVIAAIEDRLHSKEITTPVDGCPAGRVNIERRDDSIVLSITDADGQLPDAYPESLFEVAVSGATLQLIVNPKNPVQGGLSCDTVVRISNVPAGIVTLRVDRRNPGAAEVFTLGTAPAPVAASRALEPA